MFFYNRDWFGDCTLSNCTLELQLHSHFVLLHIVDADPVYIDRVATVTMLVDDVLFFDNSDALIFCHEVPNGYVA